MQLSVDYSKNPELRKLQFLAPGPKMTSVTCETENVKEEMDTSGIILDDHLTDLSTLYNIWHMYVSSWRVTDMYNCD